MIFPAFLLVTVITGNLLQHVKIMVEQVVPENKCLFVKKLETCLREEVMFSYVSKTF